MLSVGIMRLFFFFCNRPNRKLIQLKNIGAICDGSSMEYGLEESSQSPNPVVFCLPTQHQENSNSHRL